MRGSTLPAIAAVLLLAAPSLHATQLVTNDFSVDPRAAGWVYSDWSLGTIATGGWNSGGYISPSGSFAPFWVSPQFTVSPYEYYRIDIVAKGTTQYCGMGYNSTTNWGRYPNVNSNGLLVADDWTANANATQWTTYTYYCRALANATTSAIRLANGNYDSVTVSTASRADALNWSASLQARMPTLNYTPPADHLANLTRTQQKLSAKQDCKIVFLGDSIMNDASNSPIDVELEHRFGYNGSAEVKVVTAVGGGTGVDKWNAGSTWPSADLNLQAAVIDQQPDLVIIGGISNGTKYADFRSLIDKVRAGVQSEFGYNVDILIMTGAFGTGSDAVGYASNLQSIATEKGTAFMDLRSVWRSYMGDANQAGLGWSYFYRDWSNGSGTHANELGKELLGEAIGEFIAPEPATVMLLALSAVALLRRRRR